MEAFKIYEKPVMIGLWFFLKNNVNCLSLNFKFVLRGVVEITAAPQPDGRRFDNSWEPFFSFFFQLSLVKAGVHVKAVLMSLNTAFLPTSRSRFK